MLTPSRKLLQSRHRHSRFQDLILLLKPLRDICLNIYQNSMPNYNTKIPNWIFTFQFITNSRDIKVRYLKWNKFSKSLTDRSLATLYISVAKEGIFWSWIEKQLLWQRSSSYAQHKKLGACSYCVPTMHLKQNWGQWNNMYLKYIIHKGVPAPLPF